ncbi:MAG: 5-bromo-4-chloroindolyl phosphate hydrolysis family protein, partial [Roseinatronobacter sp.]|nr:5-bromo-4-chloroindolyl phosphate hydrolysis family protein [Roseinatronobacter sp.]
LTGAALGLETVAGGPGGAAILGILGAGLHALAFGPDPMRDKGREGVASVQTERVANAVKEAESHLGAMQDAIRRSGERALAHRVERFAATIRPLFRAVENDPRRLSAARRYLGIYLVGARDATVKFAELYARSKDDHARAAYEALLDDLESRFEQRREALLADDRGALDIEIEVLRERLAREGLRPAADAGSHLPPSHNS